MTCNLIRAGGRTAAEIASLVKETYPASKISDKQVYWYAWDLKSRGESPPPWPRRARAEKA